MPKDQGIESDEPGRELSTERAAHELTAAPAGLPDFAPRTFRELIEFADRIAQTTFIPESYRGKPGDIIACVMLGRELGYPALTSLRVIAVINGRPSVWGDGIWAKVVAHPKLLTLAESTLEQVAVEKKAWCEIRRRDVFDANGEPRLFRSSFSMADAELAGLLEKNTPWKTYPNRMCLWRARGFVAHDAFPEMFVSGVELREVAQDYDVDITPGMVHNASVRVFNSPPEMPSAGAPEGGEQAGGPPPPDQPTQPKPGAPPPPPAGRISAEQMRVFWPIYRKIHGTSRDVLNAWLKAHAYTSLTEVKSGTEFEELLKHVEHKPA